MTCENCKKREATLHVQEISVAGVVETHLCETCAREKGVLETFEPGTVPLKGLVTALVGGGPVLDKKGAPKVTCRSCGLSWEEFRGAGKLAEKLRAHREAAYLARQLTVIACDMPLEFELETLRRRKPDLPALEAFYDRQKLGPALRRQAERLAGTVPF